jgi:hypothetical protein
MPGTKVALMLARWKLSRLRLLNVTETKSNSLYHSFRVEPPPRFPVWESGRFFFMEDLLDMECGITIIKYQLGVLVLAVLLAMTFSPTVHAKSAESLLDDVVSLKLGLSGYVIGEKLDAGQKKIAEKHPVEGAYEGTYKFIDNILNVVVDSKTDRVLALYQQKKAADKNQLKAMVVELMDHFGAPTTIAHEKILYWAFNKHGAVSEDDFNKAKEVKQAPELGIIATVKLNSEMEITPDPKEDEASAADTKAPATGSIYFIITSDPLVQEFMAVHPQQ